MVNSLDMSHPSRVSPWRNHPSLQNTLFLMSMRNLEITCPFPTVRFLFYYTHHPSPITHHPLPITLRVTSLFDYRFIEFLALTRTVLHPHVVPCDDSTHNSSQRPTSEPTHKIQVRTQQKARRRLQHPITTVEAASQ